MKNRTSYHLKWPLILKVADTFSEKKTGLFFSPDDDLSVKQEREQEERLFGKQNKSIKEIALFNEIHGKPINHCVILADEYGETKIVDEIGISIEDGSIHVNTIFNESHSPDSDHISNVRMLFFETLDEYQQFISDFHN